ncbi:alanyl-tRNA editing protein AlaXM [Sulfurisphaera ohwakuensis]|uniref:Alanyl-tRNA editing protein AlaX n=1 Tax=Sulfurisphaera ohwakuensis TaxID=69656 RepID=A0A650CD90_SULOH|nr:alanyl-tRNA editing protein AlaXM [Sulfurisphaera ohwakuensis]MBB5253300.1 misacylated tRNA(Ala) deacylase [Sulfurisphaera ohwakuensis]QGR15800.1 alanyl-tRNA editing protein AlaX [Sulfurisphaera ohwakuensis]
MVEKLYLTDCYIKEFKAKITKIDGNLVFLDKTAFYPGGGGVENDKGYFIFNGNKIEVNNVKEIDGEIAHEATSVPFKEGDEITGVIDWERRYRMMRLHTASHIIAAIAYSKYNSKITGGNISPEYAKDDFDIDDKNKLLEIVKEANEIAKKGIPVKIYFLKKEEALKIPGIVKLAERMPPNIDIWRIVEIEGIDIQADGGPHVSNTLEIGEIVPLKIENRGKGKKRIYYTIKP